MKYVINLPSFYNDGKSMKLIMQQLNECFLSYKNEFNLEPDIILFSGENGKKIYEIVKTIFNGVYDVKCDNKPIDMVVFKSGKINSKTMVTEKGIQRGGSLSGLVVPGFCAPNISDLYTFGYTEERNVETKMEFDIIIL